MIAAPFIVVLDANVLYPFTLRDTLLRAAAAGLYQLRWTSEILAEMERSLVRTGRMTDAATARLRSVMEREFSDALVTGHEHLVSAMRNDPGDRHVAAAAVRSGAQVIVTSNLRHFADLPEGVEAQSPDEFLCGVFDLDPDAVVTLLREQSADLRAPPVPLDKLLDALARVAPDFVSSVREHLAT